jgi:hypothetical protein
MPVKRCELYVRKLLEFCFMQSSEIYINSLFEEIRNFACSVCIHILLNELCCEYATNVQNSAADSVNTSSQASYQPFILKRIFTRLESESLTL